MKRAVYAVLALATAVTIAIVQLRDARATQAESDVCVVAQSPAWRDAKVDALDLSRDSARDAASCVIIARVVHHEVDSGVALARDVLARHPDWTPDPLVARTLVTDMLARGEEQPALALARRVSAASPNELHAVIADLDASLAANTPDLVPHLSALARRVPCCDERHFAVAEWLTGIGETDAALAVLGDQLPDESVVRRYLSSRAAALAAAGRVDDLRALLATAASAGVAPGFLDVLLLHTAAMYQLRDVESTQLMMRAVERADDIQNRDLELFLFARIVQAAIVTKRPDVAQKYRDIARARGIHLAAEDSLELALSGGGAPGTIRVVVPRDYGALVSPDIDAPVVTAFAPVPAGGVITRRRGENPVRLVLRRASDDALCGTTRVRVVPGQEVRAELVPAPCRAPATFSRAAHAGDGKTRVVAVLLDSGEWRVVRALQAQGELPVLAALEAAGLSGVLTADPPTTSAAIRKLVTPARPEADGVLAQLDALGVQISAIATTHDHPWPALRFVMPTTVTLFSALAARQLVAVDLLAGQGGLGTDHGMIHGPGASTRARVAPMIPRELNEEELAIIQQDSLNTDNRHTWQVLTATTEEALATLAKKPDFMVLHIDATDRLAHAEYPQFTDPAGSDRTSELVGAYRYSDWRLGQIWSALDDDDILVVFSDHGTASSFEHDTRAMFIAAGAGVAHARLADAPAIDGLARALIAPLITPPADWPDSGLTITSLAAPVSQQP